MDCFGDITKHKINFDQTINTIISRFDKTEDSKILITESVNLAASYQISDGLVAIESWSFPHMNRLSFPMISSKDISDGQRYGFAVQEPNTLSKWSTGHHKHRVEKHYINSKIIALIGFKDDINVEPIVVFEYGFCQSMSNAIKSKTEENKKKMISEDESIQFIDGMVGNKSGDNLIIFLITKRKTSADNQINSVYKLTHNIETDEIVKTERQLVVNSSTNWCLCHKLSAILAANRLGEQLVVYSLDGNTESVLLTLNSSSIDKVYSLGTTSAGSVCLIGKTKDSNFLMELWETTYGTLLGRKTLPYEPFTNDCKIIDNTVLMTGFKGILSIPIKTQTICLSQIVGNNKRHESALDSQLNQQLNQICDDLDSSTEQSFDEISERFTEIVRQISGNIPEEIILRLLSLCSQKLTQTESNSLKCFFNRLVCLPFNDLFMISKLKSSKLNFNQIVLILQQLIELLPSNNCAIIDWISIIIDSHINQFIVNPSEETIKVIETIASKVDYFCQFCEQLDQIKTFFDIILSKNMNKSVDKYGLGLVKPNRGQYCIESLKI